MRGATSCRFSGRPSFSYFNPRSSCEERLRCGQHDGALYHFNPRSSCEERRQSIFCSCSPSPISIHAPHARSDFCDTGRPPMTSDFNPRSSCEERHCTAGPSASRSSDFNPRSSCEERRPVCSDYGYSALFQSTLLMRGATTIRAQSTSTASDFNPRSSCEERRQCLKTSG